MFVFCPVPLLSREQSALVIQFAVGSLLSSSHGLPTCMLIKDLWVPGNKSLGFPWTPGLTAASGCRAHARTLVVWPSSTWVLWSRLASVSLWLLWPQQSVLHKHLSFIEASYERILALLAGPHQKHNTGYYWRYWNSVLKISQNICSLNWLWW